MIMSDNSQSSKHCLFEQGKKVTVQTIEVKHEQTEVQTSMRITTQAIRCVEGQSSVQTGELTGRQAAWVDSNAISCQYKTS